MTGNKILEGAASLMGFELPSEEMVKIAPTVINFVLEDLNFSSIKSMEEEITLNDIEANACMVGAAMLLSVAIGDMRCKDCFSVIYNEKRSRIRTASSFVLDSLPKGEML